MITLGTNLTNILNSGGTSFWILKLYYNDESSFIGISDEDRTISGVQYHGAAQFATLAQQANLFTFTVSPARMPITIDNTLEAFSGQRFTDLYSSKNFDNRKWELFLVSGTTVSTDPIGAGITSADNDGNDIQVQLDLSDMSSRFSTQIPATAQAAGTKVPTKSVGRPIPMAYGDFDRTDSDTTSNLSSANPKGRFPALVSDSRDIDALPDSKALHTLRTENVYVTQGDFWGKIDNVSAATAATPIITFTGSRNDVFIPILFQDTADGVGSDLDNIIDEDSSTTGVLESKANGTKATYNFYFTPSTIPGTITSSDFYIAITAIDDGGGDGVDIGGTYTNAGGTVTAFGVSAQTTTDDVDVALGSGVALKLPDDTAKVTIEITNGAAAATQVSITVSSLIFDLQMESQDSFTRKVFVEQTGQRARTVFREGRFGTAVIFPVGRYVTIPSTLSVRSTTSSIFDQGDFVFYSGAGRKFDAFIDADSRNQGYNSGDLIKCPPFIVEEMLRTELSKVTADIRIAAFDAAGTTTAGDLESVFGLDSTLIDFAFSQYQFTDPLSFAEKLGSQSGTLYFIGSDGKFTCAVRKRSADYSTGDENLVLHYKDIDNISTTRTPVAEVRNDVTVSYGFDYATEQIQTIGTASTDATSQGTTVSGYNDTLNLELDMDLTLNQATADGYSDALLDYFKSRKLIITFETAIGTAQALEMGDVVSFIDWPSTFKIYNNTISATADFFMVTASQKRADQTTRLTVQEVS